MKTFHLSKSNKKFAGLCGGLGEYLDIDPSVIRVGWIVLTILTGIVPGIVAYLVAVVVVQGENDATQNRIGG
jgi:phage shock protein C